MVRHGLPESFGRYVVVKERNPWFASPGFAVSNSGPLGLATHLQGTTPRVNKEIGGMLT